MSGGGVQHNALILQRLREQRNLARFGIEHYVRELHSRPAAQVRIMCSIINSLTPWLTYPLPESCSGWLGRSSHSSSPRSPLSRTSVSTFRLLRTSEAPGLSFFLTAPLPLLGGVGGPLRFGAQDTRDVSSRCATVCFLLHFGFVRNAGGFRVARPST